jgi:hypothetical protein
LANKPKVFEKPWRQKQKFKVMKKLILSAVVFSMAVAVQAQEIPERKTERPGML